MISPVGLPEPVSIMGLAVLPFESYAAALQHIAGRIAERRKTFCVAINPEKAYWARKDPKLMEAMKEADMGICDGIGIVIGARILYGRKIKRCTGCDLFLELIAAAEAHGWKVFLLGASAESSRQASLRLLERYPLLEIVGRRDGYFRDSADVVGQINASRADLLFVAMGSPRQELWIAEHLQAINTPFCMGVGGTLDVVSGRTGRAPGIFRRTGTEFLFRLVADPRRYRRQLVLPLFVLQVLARRFTSGRYRHKALGSY